MDATTTETLGAFVQRARLSFAVARLEGMRPDVNVIDDAWNNDARHWRVTLRRAGRRMSLYFSQGSAYTEAPTVEDVLDCLASDASGYEDGRTFKDWCEDFNYDTDSRRAEAIYRTIGRQAAQLKRLLGPELYDTLLWHTERL